MNYSIYVRLIKTLTLIERRTVMIEGIIIALGIAYSFYKVRLERAKAINQELQNEVLRRELKDQD